MDESLKMYDSKVLAFKRPECSQSNTTYSAPNDMCIYRVCVCLTLFLLCMCVRIRAITRACAFVCLCVCIRVFVAYGLPLHIHINRTSEWMNERGRASVYPLHTTHIYLLRSLLIAYLNINHFGHTLCRFRYTHAVSLTRFYTHNYKMRSHTFWEKINGNQPKNFRINNRKVQCVF